ncbi:MAG: hypothetical protein HY075_16280 [Deltaproteobacteria bacterium]|nr:hypothetical protein [Deltaproteobacteria bacterium]
MLITYKRQKYPLGYLTLTQANLETVLGKKLYMDHLGNATHTPCDGLLSD